MRIKIYRAVLIYTLAALSILIIFTTLWPRGQLNAYFIEALAVYGMIVVMCAIKSSIAFISGFVINVYYLLVYHSMGINLSQIAVLPPQPVVVLLSLAFSASVSLLGLGFLTCQLFKKH